MEQKKPEKKPEDILPHGNRSELRLILFEAYQMAFRPIVLANKLVALRQKTLPKEEVTKLEKSMEIVLKLHLPLPKGFKGDPVAIKRLGIFKAEASIAHIHPLLQAVKKRLRLKNPTEKEIPDWIIRSVDVSNKSSKRIQTN